MLMHKTLFFQNLEFTEWKDKRESKEQVSFRVASTDVNRNGEYVQYLQCNRCGFYKSKTTGKRGIKAGGK